MKATCKLALYSILLTSFGLMSCDDDMNCDDSNTNTCGLTEEMCQSANKSLDKDQCLCTGENTQKTCGLTEEMCQSANKSLDKDKCLCTGENTQKTCGLTEEMCQSANKSLDKDQCLCVGEPPKNYCPLTEEICQSANKSLDKDQCLCISKDPQNTCGLTEEICLSASKTLNKDLCLCVSDTPKENCTLTARMCQSANKSFDAEKCLCVGEDHPNQCNLNEKSCQSADLIFNADDCTCFEYQIGDRLTFGRYEQDADDSTTDEPITWQVLDKKDHQYLLLSEKALDVKPFHTQMDVDVTWKTCTVRSWLNGYDSNQNIEKVSYLDDNFINAAFTEEEKAKIIDSIVPAHKNPSYETTDPGEDTIDKVFLLSITEVNNPDYFASDRDRAVVSTPYTIKNGAAAAHDTTPDDEEITLEKETYDGSCTGTCYGLWWLRTPGKYLNGPAVVSMRGKIVKSGYPTHYKYIVIRPAIWVKF